METTAPYIWPANRLDELIETLAQAAGMNVRRCGSAEVRMSDVETAARRLGLEAEPSEVNFGELEGYLKQCGPAVIAVKGENPGFLALRKTRGNRAVLLGPDGKNRVVGTGDIALLLMTSPVCKPLGETDGILDEMDIPRAARARLKTALLRERLAPLTVPGHWILRLSAGAPLGAQLSQTGLGRKFAAYLFFYAMNTLLWLASWGLVGRGALRGGLDPGWMAAWAVLLVTLVPLGMIEAWLSGVLAVGLGAIVKARLLRGALGLDPDEVRHKGVGRFLATVIESETLETMGVGGGFAAGLAIIELAAGTAVLVMGAAGWLHAVLLTAWLSATAFIALAFYKRRREWTSLRLLLTYDFVEKIVGHRTRLAQEPEQNRHEGEDRGLDGYLATSHRMDGLLVLLLGIVPKGWVIAGLVGLAPSFVRSSGATPEAVAVSLGGLLLVFRALTKLVTGFTQVTDALIAWRGIKELYAAAGLSASPPHPLAELEPKPHDKGRELVRADRLDFRFPGRERPTIAGADIEIRSGDRILLEGESGGGKSTLSALLTGLRNPTGGLLLYKGADPKTLGMETWRRHIACAPQFHENRVFTGTFLFNLLMGRRWPPAPGDVREAIEVCRELGLGELLSRMPSGILQTVGETGWQLSHGERSRLYAARLLLQGPEVMIFDESFAALDPENLALCLDAVMRRADALMLIAHP